MGKHVAFVMSFVLSMVILYQHCAYARLEKSYEYTEKQWLKLSDENLAMKKVIYKIR